MLSCSLLLQVRVMEQSFFALLRFYLRVDKVEVRVRDTRIFHRFGEPTVLREYTARRAAFADLAGLGITNPMGDPALFADKLPVEAKIVDEIHIPAGDCDAAAAPQ